jgi:PHD/YefM family antitoxin component YafN of YafNO toxin-antitoxin module
VSAGAGGIDITTPSGYPNVQERSAVMEIREVRSVAEFQKEEYVSSLRQNRTPLLLTVDGHAEIVVQDAESYQRLVERLERAEGVIAIREGLLEADAGRVHPARKALAELGTKLGLSR